MKLTVEKKDGKVYFKAPGSRAEVKVADIEGDNGVVHFIDDVLLLKSFKILTNISKMKYEIISVNARKVWQLHHQWLNHLLFSNLRKR